MLPIVYGTQVPKSKQVQTLKMNVLISTIVLPCTQEHKLLHEKPQQKTTKVQAEALKSLEAFYINTLTS